MSQQFTDKFGRTVVMNGTPGDSVEFIVADPEPHTGVLRVAFPRNAPSWGAARARIEAMQPSWYVPPEPEPEPEEGGDEPA